MNLTDLQTIDLHPQSFNALVAPVATRVYAQAMEWETKKCLTNAAACRGFLSDSVRNCYWGNEVQQKKVAEEPYSQCLVFRQESPLINKFLDNWEWFKTWQKFLGYEEPELFVANGHLIRNDATNITRLLVKLDKRVKKGILQITFHTFILKAMCFHKFTIPLNFSQLCLDIESTDRTYLNTVTEKMFFYYLNKIPDINEEFPYGHKEDDFWVHHDMYGFVRRSSVKKKTKEFADFCNFLAT